MAEFIYQSEQFVPRPLDEVFDFFSQAENLQELTPPWLNFRILDVSPKPIRQGTRIRYSLRWRVFPIRWMSEITAWEPPRRFVDDQLRGPYKRWHHEHRFASVAGGTSISDEVHYELPFGIFGRLAHALKVRRDVETIFAYRKQAIERIFPPKVGSSK